MHNHSHHHQPQKYNNAFAIAVALNTAFIIVEVFYAYSSNSMSLLADGMHNLGDVLGLIFAWAANWLLAKTATEKYSYGYKKATILAALSNALFLVLTSALIASEAIQRLMHPAPVNEQIIIIIAAIGIFINGLTAIPFLKGSHHDLNIKAAFVHLAADALISLGVVVSGILIYYTNLDWIDSVTSLIIVVTILLSTWGLLRDSVNLILAAVPHNIDQQAIKKYLNSINGVQEFHDLHIWGLSTNENALTVHLVMPETKLSDADIKQIANTLKDQHFIHHTTIQVEQGDHQYACEYCETC